MSIGAVIVKVVGERVHVSEHVRALAQPVPPAAAERLLYYILPRAKRETLRELEKDYRTDFLPKFGREEAERLYWWHALRSVAPVLGPS